jgi:hypothetical protein
MIRPNNFELIKSKPWLNDEPFSVGTTMLLDEELLLLRWIAKNCFSGDGLLLDCGCFLGGSTISFAQGLKEGTAATKKLHSFDLFVAGPFEGSAYAKEGLETGKSFRPQFEKQIAAYRDFVEVHEGDITQISLPAGDIEVLFIDCAKFPETNDFFVSRLFPRLIPGKSVLIQQDYLHEFLPWVKITMEYFADYFELLCSTDKNSVVYGCIKQIPPKATVGCMWNLMGKNLKHLLMQQAINRWQGEKRQLVIESYASYNIDDEKWK